MKLRACSVRRTDRFLPKRKSCEPVADKASPNRSASAPNCSMRISGSTPVPFDLLIRWPASSMIVAWMITSENGSRPRNSRPIMIMRATQRLMIPRSVTSTWVG